MQLTFKEGTQQTVQLTELSDDLHQISYALISSNPPVNHLGANHTIRLFRVTSDNTTFLQWTSRYSGNTPVEVIEDSRWKKRDAFEHVLEYLPAREKELLDVWERFTATQMCKVFSSLPPQAALSKEDLQRLWVRFDANKNGELDPEELVTLLESVFEFMSRRLPERLKEMMDYGDLEPEDQEEADERLKIITTQLQGAEVKIIGKELMQIMDLDKNGKISEEEFIHTFQDAMLRAVKKHRLSQGDVEVSSDEAKSASN